MITLNNVNKYFNRHKKNSIHVINNVNYSFNETGLVAILGPSGSGKTTLLNTIGGLDNINSGSIYINNERITKRKRSKIDEIRNLNIGYIFQDYKLVDNMTVFDNVALSLKLLGLKDAEEIKRRVMYALQSVGMDRYKNRPANMLSGGERQRVGIARAIVKNPKIIIADEPTGNLDSKNSLEVMNIIKSISNKYLVILVTHEEELARFYATEIIELKDGQVVNSYINKHNNKLNYQVENNIYLKDFKECQNIHKDNLNINVYRDNHENLDINIVFKNGNIYIETRNNEKIEKVDNNSRIVLINDHYKEIDNNIVDNNFDIESISNADFKPKYSSIFKIFSFISYGFKKILNYPFLKKVLLGGFFLSGMFIFYAISSIFAAFHIDEKNFIEINSKYLTGNVTKISVDEYLNYEKREDINYLLPSSSIINLNFNYDKYLQSSDVNDLLTGSLSSLQMINKDNLIMGSMPNNKEEIVVDKLVLERFIENKETKKAGFFEIKDFLNHEVTLPNMKPFKIVGITDKNEVNIYVDDSLFVDILANNLSEPYYNTNASNAYMFINYELLNRQIKLVKGKMPVNDYEVIVNINEESRYSINNTIDTKINNTKLTVVGYYESDDYYDSFLVNENMIKYHLINSANKITVYSNNEDKTLDYFHNLKINIKDSYTYSKNNYLEQRHNSMVSTLAISGVILGVSLVEILLMIRSSFLSRIKEVGIYRAIGLKKTDIYKMFSGEIIAITCIASIPGITLMAYILHSLRNVAFLNTMFMTNIFVYLISIILIIAFNIIVGLIPVYNTIRKTPAAILARFDVD